MPVPTNSATASSVNGTLVAATLLLGPNDHQTRVVLSGTYTGLQGTIDVSMDGTTWINHLAVQEDTGTVVSGTLNPSAANLSYVADTTGWQKVRFNCTQCSSGTAVQTVFSAGTLTGTQPVIANTTSITSFTTGTFSGAVSVGGALTALSTATIASTLGVTGATTLAALACTTIAASGAATFASTTGLAGDTTLTGGSDLIFTGTTGQCLIKMTDNLADALSINEGANSYITFVTTNSSEGITIKKDTTFSGGVDLIFSGTTGQCQILMVDNLANALTIGESTNAYITFVTTDSGEKISAVKAIEGTVAITSKGPTSGIGYSTGAGGVVAQATDRSTGVTLNTICGKITTQATSLAAGAEAVFVVTNSAVAVGDVILLSVRSGPTANTSVFSVSAVAAGSFSIKIHNLHASTADTGAAILNFVVLKSVEA